MLSNKKYSITIPHFYCLEYSENKKKIVVDIDFREKPIYLSTKLIKNWENPYNELALTVDEKVKIINNIKNYLVEERGFSEVYIED